MATIPQDLQQNKLTAKLDARGILEPAKRAGWEAHKRNHQLGWRYPVYDLAGEVVAWRWKNGDSSGKPKYDWPDGKPQGVEYYAMRGDLRKAIADAGGVLYIANGEIGVLTLAAAGLPALSWFGELSVPKTLAQDLKALGVWRVRYPVDRDDTGTRSGAKVAALLSGSGIDVEILQMPAWLPDKGDTNDLWQALSFDREAFLRALDELEPLALPEPETPAPVERSRAKRHEPSGPVVPWETERELWWSDVVLDYVERVAPIVRGKMRHCPNPNHADHNPSFRISFDKHPGGFPVCTCDVQSMRDARDRVAEWVGAPAFIDWFKTERGHLYQRARQGKNLRTKSALYVRNPAPAEGDADLTIHARYVTLPETERRAIALQSDVGTGKTHAAIQAAANAGRVVYLTHRELLAENFSRNAYRAGVAIEHYKELETGDMRRAPKLAICIPTYAKLADGKGGKLPTADLLILDEFDQLLQFVYSDNDLFEGDDAIRAAEALKFAIRSAGRVLALDAHLSPLALDYLRSIRGADDVCFVRNTYQTERGRLTLHDKRESAIDAGLQLVAENAGTVAFACASAKRALDLAQQAVSITGDAGSVLVVTRENADGEQQRAFLRDPNAEIGQYRALIYSPIIGTGYDITAPVRAVVGIGAAFQTAEDARQMLGRCRNAQEAHVWLPETSNSRPEDAAAIFQAGIDNAQKTHFAISDDGSAVCDIAPALKSFHKMHSLVMARRNNSTNNLRGRFVALSEGYKIEICTAESPALRETMRAIAEARTERLKALALQLPAIDAETYRRAYEAGQVTDEIEAAARRGKIESATGLTISPELRDRLWTADQRRQLRNFTDLLDDFAELKLFDAEEAATGKPLHARAHRVVRRRVCNAFINVLISPDGETPTYSKSELEQALRPVIDEHAASLRGLFGWRPDRCEGAASIARRVLKTVGLRLRSSQRMTNGQRERFYQLDGECLARMRELARARLAMLARKRAAERDESKLLKTAKTDDLAANGSFKQTPVVLDETPQTPVFAAQKAAGLPVNRVAKGVAHAHA